MPTEEELQSCNGCYIRHYSCLLQLNDIKRKDCPCRSCLIKGVCKNKCNDRVKLWNDINPNEQRDMTIEGILLKL